MTAVGAARLATELGGYGRRRGRSGRFVRTFVGLQVCLFLLSLSLSEEGNPAVYTLKYLATGLPLLSCCALYALGRNLSGAIVRSCRSFRHIWWFIGLGALSIGWAADAAYTAQKIATFAGTFLALHFLLAQYELVPAERRAECLMRHLLHASFVLTLGMALNYFVFGVGGALSGDARFRAGGTLFAPTNAAATVGLGFLLGLYQLVRIPGRRQSSSVKLEAAATLVLSVWALSVLSTRAAYISVVVGLVVAPLLARGPALTYRKLLHAATLLSLVGLLALNLNALAALLTRELDTESVWSMSGRIWLWQKAFADLTPVRAVLGYGFAAISESIGIRDWWTGDKMLSGAHNAYLQAFLGNGIFGLIFFVRFLVEHWRTLRRAAPQLHRRQLGLGFALLVYFIVFGGSEHLFGLNLTPAFFLLCGAYASVRGRVSEAARRALAPAPEPASLSVGSVPPSAGGPLPWGSPWS